jgi:hypothetical protein
LLRNRRTQTTRSVTIKVEYFSAVIEGVMIVVAALLIVHEAYGNFQQPRLLSCRWKISW